MYRKAILNDNGNLKEIKLNIYKDAFGYTTITYTDENNYDHTVCGTPDVFADSKGKNASRPRLINELLKQLAATQNLDIYLAK